MPQSTHWAGKNAVFPEFFHRTVKKCRQKTTSVLKKQAFSSNKNGLNNKALEQVSTG